MPGSIRYLAGRPPEAGFTYLGVLFLLALVGLSFAATGIVWQTLAKREREAELLFIGAEFQRALRSYARIGQGPAKAPRRLEDLLRDPRFPDSRRHLRRIYADPMTGEPQWGLARDASGGITAVYSLSTAQPVKRANFPAEFSAFGLARSYADWRFATVAAPAGPVATRDSSASGQPPATAGRGASGPPAAAPMATAAGDEADSRDQHCAAMLGGDLAACGDPQIAQRYGAAQVTLCRNSAQVRQQQCGAGLVPTQLLLYRPEFGR